MDTWGKYLGPFSEALNLPISDLSKSGILANQQIPIGFLYELRYKWELQTHADVLREILKLKPVWSSVSIKSVQRKLSTCLNRVKLYMELKDERLDSYLKQNFAPLPRNLQGRNVESSDDLYDDLIDENDASSDQNKVKHLVFSKNTEENSNYTINRNVFQEVNSNASIPDSFTPPKDSDHDNIDLSDRDNVDISASHKEKSEFDLNFSDIDASRSSSRKNTALTEYLRGPVATLAVNEEHDKIDSCSADGNYGVLTTTGQKSPESSNHELRPSMQSKEELGCLSGDEHAVQQGLDLPDETQDESMLQPDLNFVFAKTGYTLEQGMLDEEHSGESTRKTRVRVQQKNTSVECEYWPAERKMKMTDLNPLLLCKLCNCYLFRATTVTECMHTYCRKCIYYHIERSKNCPECGAIIDASNPKVGLREDKMYQQLLDRILPSMAKQDKRLEEEFYLNRNISVPSAGTAKKTPSRKKSYKTWISLKLTFIGCSSEVTPTHLKLQNPFVLIPTEAYVSHIEKYVTMKLSLDRECKCLLFYQDYVLHEDLNLYNLLQLHLETHSQAEAVELCYGIVSRGPDYFHMLPSNAMYSDPEQMKHTDDVSTDTEILLTDYESSVQNPECRIESEKISSKRFQQKSQSPRKCALCGEITESLKRHISVTHGSLNLCRRRWIFVSSKQVSGAPVHFEKRVPCWICNKFVANMYYHLYKVHKVTDKEECQMVAKYFK